MEKKIKQDLKVAMLARDEIKVSTLRMLLSEINNAAIAKGNSLSDPEIISVVQKELKKRKESVEAFKKGNRLDAAAKEEIEAKVLENYLPSQLSDEELTQVVTAAINEAGAKSVSDMGRVIGLVREKVQAQADPSRISSVVKERLLST